MPTPPRTEGQETDQATSTGSDVLQQAGERHLDRGAEHGPGEAAERGPPTTACTR